jgi:hypothetical protein
MPKVALRITMRITRDDADLKSRLAAATGPGLNRAADLLVQELRQVVSIQNPTAGNMHNRFAGRPPFARTGRGMRSIRRTATGRISMLAYMAMLEFGTSRIAPRPWYRVTIQRLKQQLAELALGK